MDAKIIPTQSNRNLSTVKAHLTQRAIKLGVSPTLTTMSVKIGLQGALQGALAHHPKKLRRKLELYFEDRARTLGSWRAYISLYASYRYAKCIENNDS